tara:strand:- start:1358 stop:1744 length:387 start_codon:yes stop_codon:yes gene_type:complete
MRAPSSKPSTRCSKVCSFKNHNNKPCSNPTSGNRPYCVRCSKFVHKMIVDVFGDDDEYEELCNSFVDLKTFKREMGSDQTLFEKTNYFDQNNNKVEQKSVESNTLNLDLDLDADTQPWSDSDSDCQNS